MTSLMDQPVFALYAGCSAALIVILYVLGGLTARTRNARKAVINTEDQSINGGANVVDIEHPDVQRIKRAHLNAIENTLPFVAIGFLYTQTSPSMTVAAAFFLTFVAVRLLHAIFYLLAIQPFRTLSFAVGALINFAMVVQVLRAAIH